MLRFLAHRRRMGGCSARPAHPHLSPGASALYVLASYDASQPVEHFLWPGLSRAPVRWLPLPLPHTAAAPPRSPVGKSSVLH